MRQVLPFVLCGGAGTRLWPLSREAFPKQFHRLTGPETLFQQTCRRLTAAPFGPLFILANRRHRFLVADQLEEIGAGVEAIMLEPAGRNTAPAACVAALAAARDDPETPVLLAPSDHVIADDRAFARAVENGLPAADAGALVVFGVAPDRPHTGYGYVETEPGPGNTLNVVRFVEKPTREEAQACLDSGKFYWNAGLFLFKAAAMIELMQRHAPEILSACRQALAQATSDLGFRVLGASYAEAPTISLDYAVAEKAATMRCVPLGTAWSDVGSWPALWDASTKDQAGNVARGEADIVLEDTSNSFVISDRACVALVGVENVVVAATEDAVLVLAKDKAQSVRRVVDTLKGKGGELTAQHARVYRPWGWYQTLNRGDRYQVKCIMVKPGGRLSLQSHKHRSEHWVVVEGAVEVTRGGDVTALGENQSTYIPAGEKHRLANPGQVPALLIEVQSGTYFGEDDIVRYDDIYGRGSSE